MLRYAIFTGGVVKANGICCACFLRKRRRCGEQPRPLCQFASLTATSPKGRGLGMAVKFPAQVPSDRFRQRLSLWESWRVSA